MNENFICYKNDSLCIEDLQINEIIREVGSPAYLYSANLMRSQLNKIKQAFKNHRHLICFSVKSCHNINILKMFNDEGCGLDIVSYGELFRSLKAGCSPDKIVASGVGKTEEDITKALETDILMFNVESIMELERLNYIAQKLGKKARISFRVNPNVDAKTHPYITTGLNNNKFGIDFNQIIDAYKLAQTMSNIEIVGIDCHIGSQLLDMQPYYDTAKILADCVSELKRMGILIKYVDFGGGLGVPYKDTDLEISAEDYRKALTDAFEGMEDITFILELGRFLTAEAGVLVTTVEYTKENTIGKKFVIVDSGMHHLIRTPLYSAYHKIIPVQKHSSKKELVSIVGPICESTDYLAKDYMLEKTEQGELLAVLNAGAYGMSLSSHYNSHLKPVEVLVDGHEYKIIRKREVYEDLIANEVL